MNIQTHMVSLRDRLLACKATNAELADAAGHIISPSWISKFRSGRMKNPRIDSLLALDSALAQCELARQDRLAKAA
jgi:DNA-binding Xre family transcriptional regulator